jgi:hypothetical protein
MGLMEALAFPKRWNHLRNQIWLFSRYPSHKTTANQRKRELEINKRNTIKDYKSMA